MNGNETISFVELCVVLTLTSITAIGFRVMVAVEYLCVNLLSENTFLRSKCEAMTIKVQQLEQERRDRIEGDEWKEGYSNDD